MFLVSKLALKNDFGGKNIATIVQLAVFALLSTRTVVR